MPKPDNESESYRENLSRKSEREPREVNGGNAAH